MGKNKYTLYAFVKSLDVILQNPDEKLVIKQLKEIVKDVLIETATKEHGDDSEETE